MDFSSAAIQSLASSTVLATKVSLLPALLPSGGTRSKCRSDFFDVEWPWPLCLSPPESLGGIFSFTELLPDCDYYFKRLKLLFFRYSTAWSMVKLLC